MESNSNSVSHNLQKLRKYESKSHQVTDPSKAMVYGQKINFYKSNLKGAGVTSDALNVNAQAQPVQPAQSNQAETTVDELINNIDNLIQESRTSPQVQTGGSIPSITGHRIMTTGNRSQYVQQSQHGGTLSEDLLKLVPREPEAGSAAAAAAGPQVGDIVAAQEKTVEQIVGQLKAIGNVSQEKIDTILRLRAEIDRLKGEEATLQEREVDDDAEKGELEDGIALLTKQLEDAMIENDELKETNNALEAEKKALEDQMGRMVDSKERNDLQAQLAKVEAARRELAVELADMKQQVEDLTADKERLEGELHDKIATTGDAERELADIQARLAEAEKSMGVVEEYIERLQSENAELRRNATVDLQAQLERIQEAVQLVSDEQTKGIEEELRGTHDGSAAVPVDNDDDGDDGDMAGGGRNGYTEIDNLLAMSVVDPTRFDFI